MSYILSTKHARKSDRDFIVAAARAYYVCWWADNEEEKGRCHGGCELTDVAPETQPWAFKAARELAMLISLKLRRSLKYEIFLDSILESWRRDADMRRADRDLTEENLGWYAAMQAMGHGVGLRDLGIVADIPYLDVQP